MKQLASALGALIAVIGVSPSYATEQTTTSTVTHVYPQSDGSFYLSLADPPSACSSQYTPKRLYVKVGQNSMTADALKVIYAAALVSLTTELTVYLAYDDASSLCYVNRLLVYRT